MTKLIVNIVMTIIEKTLHENHVNNVLKLLSLTKVFLAQNLKVTLKTKQKIKQQKRF